MDFLIPKQDKQRHKLLGMLYEKVMSHKARTISEEKLAVYTSDISKQLKISVDEVRLLVCSLTDKEIKFEDFGNGEVVVPREDSGTSFASRKYLKSGKDLTISRIKDYLTVTVSGIAIVTAIITATTSLISILDNHKRIKQLESTVDTIKAQLSQKAQPEKYPNRP